MFGFYGLMQATGEGGSTTVYVRGDAITATIAATVTLTATIGGSTVTTRDLTAIRGDTFNQTVTITSADSAVSSALMHVRGSVNSSATILTFSTSSITDNGNDTYTFYLTKTAADMAAIAPGAYVYDLQVTLADSTVHTPLSGAFVVTADVTRV